MSNTFHDTYVGHNNHAITANPDDGSYADIIARDADTAFQIDSNINKVVRVDSPLSYYILTSISPAIWIELGTSTLIGLIDTPSSYSGQAGNVLQVNSGETAVEFGQKLRITDNPTFAEVTANGIIVGVAIPLNTTHRQIVTGNPHSVLASQLSDYNSVWDTRLVTKDTGDLSEGIINLYYTEARVNANTNVLANTTHKSSDGSDHTFIDQSVVVASSPTFVDLVLTGNLTVQGTTTTINTTTLLVEDKNIELGVVATPTDVTADGGGITLKGDTDKTILWSNVTNSWDFNQSIRVGNLELSGNTISSFDTNGDIILSPNGTGNVSVSSNIIIGSTSVNPDGTLHVHTGSAGAVTASSVANGLVVEHSTSTGISILTPAANSGRLIFGSPADPFGAFLAWSDLVNDFAIGSSKIGANLRLTSGQETTNLTLSGGAGSELATFAKDVTITGQISISGGNPENGKVLRSDADGLAFWSDVGWTDLGTDVVLLNSGDSVGIGAIPDGSAKLDVASTTKGFLPPRMTTAEIDAIVSPAIGLESYDNNINKKKVFTGAEFKTFLTEDLGQVVIQETFASTNVRFFGELALPTAQGWTDTATGSATIDLATQTVFGEVRQVVRHNDNTGNGSTTSKITLTAQNWVDVNAFGASYSGTTRLDTVNGINGFFSGLQANSAENPLATGNRRYGILFNNNLGNLRLIEADNNPGNSVTMDGTGGNPLIPFDQFFRWECLVPAGLGAAQVFINGILTTFVPLFLPNGGGLGTQIIVSSGSTGGTGRIAFHDNFGVTIYEEAATKTLASATMAANVAQVNIPEGRRDYTITLPDGNPRPIGSVLRLVANNLGGSVKLQNENPAAPEILYNGLRTLAINIAVKETIEGINTVDQANVYLGFEIAIRHVGGKFIDTTDQIIVVAGTPQVITFNVNKILDDIAHTIGSSVFNINTSGTYKLEVAPQVFQGASAAKVEFWFRKNGTDIANSGVQFDIGANNQALPILIWKEEVVASDIIECVWASDSENTKLDNLTSLFGGPNIPSIMFRMTLVDI